MAAHCPEMFPLFPYELYGLGLPDLELMKRTSLATGRDPQRAARRRSSDPLK